MKRFAKSLLSRNGELVWLQRSQGTKNVGGSSMASFTDPEEAFVILRPGDIDTPHISPLGAEGSSDWWLVAPLGLGISADDLITRKRAFGEQGFGEGRFGHGETYRISHPRESRKHGVALFQADETEPNGGGW